MADKDILLKLGETIAARKGADAGTSYVASLMAKGEDAILRKVLEEAAPFIFRFCIISNFSGPSW